MMNENVMTKKFICDAHFTSDTAADKVRELMDSKYVASQLTEAERQNLEKCAIFLTRLAKRFKDQYNTTKAYMD